MQQELSKVKRNTKRSFRRLFLILLTVIILIEIINLVAAPSGSPFFIHNSNEETAVFNTTVLGEIYKDFNNTPYNYSTKFNIKKNYGSYRVFLIGEASLSGWPYSPEQSVAKKIEANLRRYMPGKKVELFTISFAGFNSYHAVDVVSRLSAYNPDLVIVYSGHNEFYGYKGNYSGEYLSRLLSVEAINSFVAGMASGISIPYDKKTDDFELMLPLFASDKFINNDKQLYRTILQNYAANLSRVAESCKQNKIDLTFSDISDNTQLPPVGISNLSGQLSADIVFNNARMALLRDGNEAIAQKLFDKSIELDGFRLRIPAEFSDCLKRIAEANKITVAELKKEFCKSSQNHIPGNDLFLDYIHPNRKGLEIIAAVYTRMIMERAAPGVTVPTNSELLENQESPGSAFVENDLILEKVRIEKSSALLKKAKLSGKITPAAF